MSDAAAGKPQVMREIHGRVALLRYSAPPGNRFVAPLRRALAEALEEVLHLPDVAGLVLVAAGRDSCTGPVSAADAPDDAAAPSLADLAALVENSPRPVVVALAGAVRGGGAALALAAHYRLAAGDLRLGFSEIHLGLVPGGGVTQRLPRLAGAGTALEMLLDGRDRGAAEARDLGLLDGIASVSGAGQALESAALQFAARSGLAPRPTSARLAGAADPAGYGLAVRRARARHRGPGPEAAGRIVDCIEAAQIMPFDVGLDVETSAVAECAASEASSALRHIARAEARLLRAVPRHARQSSEMVLLLGLGQAATEHLAARAAEMQAGGETLLLAAPDARHRTAAQLQMRRALAELGGGNHAGQEDPPAALLTEVPAVLARLAEDPPPLVLAPANGDGVAALAALMPDLPQGVVPVLCGSAGEIAGIGPAPLPGLVGLAAAGTAHLAEVVQMSGDAAPGAARVMALALRMGRLPLRCVGQPLSPVLAERLRRATLRVTPKPAQMQDMVRALLDWGAGSAFPMPKPGSGGGDGPTLADPLARITAALANAGARLLEEGTAMRPADIDLVACGLLGYPRWRGGPMWEVDRQGIMVFLRRLEAFAADDPALWQPAALFGEVMRNGWHMADLDG